MLRRHRRLVINLGGRDDHPALLAAPRFDHLAIFSALKCPIEAIQAQVGFWPILPVATCARLLQHRLNIFRVRQAGAFRSGRQLAHIQLAEIRFAIAAGCSGECQRPGDQKGPLFIHNHGCCCEYVLLIPLPKSSATKACVIAEK
jgi:hypothetical protein